MEKYKKDYKKLGFTLIELLAVIVILGLLVAIAFPSVSKYINETRENTYTLHEADMKTAASNMMSECVQKDTADCVPNSGESKKIYLNELVEKQYSKKIKDPKETSNYCSDSESYVVVTNSNSNVVDLEYNVCLVCDGYKSGYCDETIPGSKCGPESDNEKPKCGDVVGESNIWTNSDRVISIKCEDDCGCKQDTYYKRVTEEGKTSIITIEDVNTKTEDCEVNTYIDKTKPTCTLEVEGSLGSSGWYGGNEVVVKLVTKTDGLSGVATYGMGTSKKTPNFNKNESYKVSPGISMIYGYVKDNAGNIGTCSVEVKYDNAIPTGEFTYGYKVYPKDDIGTKSGSKITLNSITSEYGDISSIRVYLSSNSSGMTTTLSNGGTSLSQRTISSGVTEMLYTFTKGTYNNIVLDMGSSSNADKVEKIELITDHTSGFYTNQNVVAYLTSHDSLSGKSKYSFDGGSTWQNESYKEFTANKVVKAITQDVAGNNSELIESSLNNIDKLNPNDANIETNGGTYTILVGSTSLNVSSKVTASDQNANSDYAKSGVRGVYYNWTTNTTQPTTWNTTTSGSTLTKSSGGGNNYLWIKTVDKAGNVKITRSNNYNVGYQVTYDCNGGSGCPSDQRKVYNDTLTLSSTVPTRSGYTFMGWGTSASTHSTISNSYTENKSIKLYAIWKKTLTFTFNGNEASLNKATSSCDIYNAETNCNLSLPTITREGFTLTGFNTTASATSAVSGWTSGATVSVSDTTSKTWYAITYKDVTITFNKNGATSIGKTSDTCRIQNSATSCSITAPSITRSGFTIVGWNTSSSATTSGWNVGASKSFSSSTTYYAIATKTITITFNKNGASSIGETSKTCTIKSTATSCSITSPSITAASGFTIVGWNTSSSATSSGWNVGASEDFSSNATYNAITKKNEIKYTVNYYANGGSGTTSSNSCTISAVYNGAPQSSSCSISLASNGFSKTGYNFNGWNTSSSATSGTSAGSSVTISSNTNYYAIWKIKSFTVSFHGNGATSQNYNSSSSCNADGECGLDRYSNGSSYSSGIFKHNGAYQYNVERTLPTNRFARTGYIFKGWATSANGSVKYANKGKITLTANENLYAVWQKQCTTHVWNARGNTIINNHYGGSSIVLSCSDKHPSGHADAYPVYCSVCGMSARYYNDNIGSNAPTMACPVSPPSDFTVVPGGGDTTLSAYKSHSGGFDF